MKCHVCQKGYDPADVEMYNTTKGVQMQVLDMNNPGMRQLLGMKTLMKCGNCGKICCADCARQDAGGPTGLACPACGVAFGVRSFVPPTAQAVSAAPEPKPEPEPKPVPKTEPKPEPKPEPKSEKSGFFSRLFKK